MSAALAAAQMSGDRIWSRCAGKFRWPRARGNVPWWWRRKGRRWWREQALRRSHAAGAAVRHRSGRRLRI